MDLRHRVLIGMALAIILSSAACTPEGTAEPVDMSGTLAAQMASVMLTQTAAAASPTPPPATATETPAPTDTPTPEPTRGPVKRPAIRTFTGCYYGPGLEYGLDSNISENKKVQIVGIGSVPGWYVIINPYFHKQCWVAASDLEVDPKMDLSGLPVMTPIP
jgi:hypothetical protein